MTPDVIVCWPRFADYPLWRRFIADNRERFGKVIVVFTEHDGRDISNWVCEHFTDDITYLDSPDRGDRDWRDVAVNAALDVSDAEWVWFTEPDFIITESDWWRRSFRNAERRQAYGWIPPRDNRWHPSCLFVRRSVVNETTRNFAPVGRFDHFWLFGQEIADRHEIVDLEEWGKPTFEHLRGTTQNQWLISVGTRAGLFNPHRYAVWLRDCLVAGVPLEPEWKRIAEGEIARDIEGEITERETSSYR